MMDSWTMAQETVGKTQEARCCVDTSSPKERVYRDTLLRNSQ